MSTTGLPGLTGCALFQLPAEWRSFVFSDRIGILVDSHLGARRVVKGCLAGCIRNLKFSRMRVTRIRKILLAAPSVGVILSRTYKIKIERAGFFINLLHHTLKAVKVNQYRVGLRIRQRIKLVILLYPVSPYI